MLDERKAAILKAVVETYIETAEPVGSSAVVAHTDLGVSSATIRNELGQLDDQGYLTQPHTSAGRIPTDKAYREFVDGLDGTAGLGVDELATVRRFFDDTHGEIEEMLARTSRLLSSMTGVASVVVAPDREQAVVRSVQLVHLGGTTVLAVLVLSDGTVEKATFDASSAHHGLDSDVDDVVCAVAGGHLSAALVGRTIAEAGVPTPTGNAAADRLVGAARAALTSSPTENSDVYVGGLSSVPESFETVDSVRDVLAILEKQLVVVTLIRDVLDRGMRVAIGGETGAEPLAECALVVAPYSTGDERQGTIGLLGPSRMNYPHAMAAVAVVSQSLETRLSEG